MQSPVALIIILLLVISCMASVAVGKDDAQDLRAYDPLSTDHKGESLAAVTLTRKPTPRPSFRPTTGRPTTAKPSFKPVALVCPIGCVVVSGPNGDRCSCSFFPSCPEGKTFVSGPGGFFCI